MACADASFAAYGILYLFTHTMVDYINHDGSYITTLYDTLYHEMLKYIAPTLFRMLIIWGSGEPNGHC